MNNRIKSFQIQKECLDTLKSKYGLHLNQKLTGIYIQGSSDGVVSTNDKYLYMNHNVDTTKCVNYLYFRYLK